MIEGKPVVEARIGLLPAESGGLQSPIPTGTRSLLLVFPSIEDQSKETKIGAMIDVKDGPALIPGRDGVNVIIRFWADDASVYATPGASFTLWYGRAVGAGVVTGTVDQVTIA